MSDDSSPTPEKSAAGEMKDDSPSVEELAKWLAEDPANMEKHSQILERACAGELGELPPEFLANAKKLLAKRREERVVRLVRDKLENVKALLGQSVGSMRADERLAECHSLMEEVTDALLDVPEPRRTKLFQQFLPIREMVAALRDGLNR
jgi:hypothetical protein